MNCGAQYHARVFPAYFGNRSSLVPADGRAREGEATCYEHAARKAVASCNRCGRFVCELCRLGADGLAWCPTCLVSQVSHGQLPTLEAHRTLYDSIALGAAALPLLTTYMAMFTGPVALFLTIRFWRRPSSLIPRNKWRLAVALVLSILESALLIAFVILLIWAVKKNARQ